MDAAGGERHSVNGDWPGVGDEGGVREWDGGKTVVGKGRREPKKIGVDGGVNGELSVNRGGPGCSGAEKGNGGGRECRSGNEDRCHDDGKEDGGVHREETGSWELEVEI